MTLINRLLMRDATASERGAAHEPKQSTFAVREESGGGPAPNPRLAA